MIKLCDPEDSLITTWYYICIFFALKLSSMKVIAQITVVLHNDDNLFKHKYKFILFTVYFYQAGT